MTYLSCKKSGQNNCSYSDSPYASDDLIQNTISSPISSGDPILCSQTLPNKILIGQINQVTPLSATATVTEQFTSKQAQIIVDLKKVGDIWRLSNIGCPS